MPTEDDLAIREQFLNLQCRADLANLLGVSEARLIWHAVRSNVNGRYSTFSIPKKAGGERSILAPSPGLKLLQRLLKDVLQTVYQPRSSTFGFVVGRNTKMNAEKHVSKKWVFNCDLEDFFPSINFGRVRGLLMAMPYSLPAEVATTVAQLCCHEN